VSEYVCDIQIGLIPCTQSKAALVDTCEINTIQKQWQKVKT